jgi:hypothetical protein
VASTSTLSARVCSYSAMASVLEVGERVPQPLDGRGVELPDGLGLALAVQPVEQRLRTGPGEHDRGVAVAAVTGA